MTPKVRENKIYHKAALRSLCLIIQPLLAIQLCHIKRFTQLLSEITTLLPTCTCSEPSRKEKDKIK